MNQPESQYLTVAIEAARRGADALMDHWGRITVREKAPKDLVTDADYASQQAIFDTLRQSFPEHRFVGEEDGAGATEDGGANGGAAVDGDVPCWVVDPLDGTLNYVHQLQGFCVSIGLVQQGIPRVGVVLDPLSDQLFVATEGGGAHLSRVDGTDRHPIGTSGCTELGAALLACSFRAGVRKTDLEVAEFCEVLEACQALRRLGSCALNLCYVAAGRLDGYWARSVKAWDMVAGALIVQEAGGVIGPLEGDRLDIWRPRFAATATPSLYDQLLERITRAAAD